MFVTLTAGDLSVELPYPAHESEVVIYPDQTLHRVGSGDFYTMAHGGKWYEITRTFESLDEALVQQLFAFWQAINGAATQIVYSYVDGQTRRTVNVNSIIMRAPTEMKLMRNLRDVQIVFGQALSPDNVTDAAGGETDVLGGGHGGGGSIGSGSGAEGPPVLTSQTVFANNVGDTIGYGPTYDGLPLVSWEFDPGALPPGLSLIGSAGSQSLTGTLTTPGSFPIQIAGSNSLGSAVNTLTFSVSGPGGNATAPHWTSSNTLNVGVDVPFSYTMTASGDTPITFSFIGAPPAGLSISGATLSGSYPAAGTYTVNLRATNDAGSADMTLTITAVAGYFTSPLTVLGIAGDECRYEVGFSPTGSFILTATGLPAGLTLTGLQISGLAPVPGVYSIGLQVVDDTGTHTDTLTLRVPSSVLNLPSVAMNRNLGSGHDWANPNFIKAADAQFAASTIPGHGSDVTSTLIGLGFNTTPLPGGATVVGYKLHFKGTQSFSPVSTTLSVDVYDNTPTVIGTGDFWQGVAFSGDQQAFGTSNGWKSSCFYFFNGIPAGEDYALGARGSLSTSVGGYDPTNASYGIGINIRNTSALNPATITFSVDAMALEIFYF
jgi:hypothetical protein